MTKAGRQNTILKIIEQEQISSQDELRKRLHRAGFKVTQATLSRDVNELGLVKGPDGYHFPVGGPAPLAAEQVLPSANRLVREFVLGVREAQNLVVIKTAVGSAGTVAASLDGEAWPEVIGTIAGDDTILIITTNSKAAGKLVNRTNELLA
jgi:transcriptional regulator of arginine metabolism